jgi:putative transposase
VIRFIDGHRDRRRGELRWGIEPMCRVLQIAPSTCHAAKSRPPSLRAVRDAELRPEVLRVWEQNLAVYGADKVWHHLNHEDDITVARCTVERLMKELGIAGCRRGRVFVRTTIGDETLERPADLVERQFRAPAPNRLWVADLTYVKTHAGWVYVAFIIDVFSRFIVGWQASKSLRADLAIDALEMAVHNRGADGLAGLVHHSDRGVQYLAVRYSRRLADNDIVASVGSKGDSFDNAMAESFNGLYKWELIYPKGPWNGLDDVEFATLSYVDWFNRRRLHGEIEPGAGFTTPAAFEATWREGNSSATLSAPRSVSIDEGGTDHPADTTAQAVNDSTN